MKKSYLRLLSSLCLISSSSVIHAAAFQLYELGTPIIGTAGVGQAVIEDASSSYFNPASMAYVSQSQIMLGSQLLLPYTNFSPNSSNTISGNNGGNAATLIPGLGMFYVHHDCHPIQWGISLTAPYGGLLNYNDGWVGRYNIQNTQMLTLNLNPAIAYRINEWVAVGAGISIQYADLRQTVAIPLPLLPDGKADINVDSYAPGFNLGAMFTPTRTTKIGLAYRSKIHHHLKGDVTFYRLSTSPSVSTHLEIPQNIIASIAQNVNAQFTLLGELGWANWSSMQDTILTINGVSPSIPRNWHDTYRIGVGGQYQYNPELLLQAGASYDSSPTNASKRLPDLPMDRQIRIGAGMIYALTKAVNMGLAYEYINFGDAKINQTSSVGVLSGHYSRNYANVFQLSLNVAV